MAGGSSHLTQQQGASCVPHTRGDIVGVGPKPGGTDATLVDIGNGAVPRDGTASCATVSSLCSTWTESSGGIGTIGMDSCGSEVGSGDERWELTGAGRTLGNEKLRLDGQQC